MEALGPIEKPAPYRVADKREWIVSEEEDSAGFAILVRTGITNAEQQSLLDRHNEIAGRYSEEWNAQPPEERDLSQSPRAKELELLTPYVLDWNATAPNADGEWVELAAPAINGPAVWDFVTEPERSFCTRVVLNGYLILGKAMQLRRRLSATGDLSDPEPAPATPTPKRRDRRKTLSTPSASVSTD